MIGIQRRNHLGNTLAIISDKRFAGTTKGGVITSYVPDIVSATDYSSFGVSLLGRQINAANVEYGFNGKWNEVETGYQNYGMRDYDAKARRFASVDPLTKKYPGENPYIFGGNNPVFMIDNDGKKKTTFYITIDDRTGKTQIRQIQTKELFREKIEVASSAFGISTHDTHSEYDWFDITSLVITHIDENGKATTTTNSNNHAKLRATTNFDFGQGYANLKLDISDKFKAVKENSVSAGYVMTSATGGNSESKYNKSSSTIYGIIDIDLLKGAMDAAVAAGDVESSEEGLAGLIKKAVYNYNRAIDIQENNATIPNLKNKIVRDKKGVVAHCRYCNTNYRDSNNQWVPTEKSATDTMDGVTQYDPVDKTPLKKGN